MDTNNRFRLENTDCLNLLKELPDKSVDLVLIDPPYFIDYDGGKGWDSCWQSEAEYLKWCEDWTAEAVRVLKDHRMMCVFGTLKTDTFLRYKLQTNRASLTPQEEIIWSYNWGNRKKTNFARKHEYLWSWSKGDKFLFNADDVRVARKVVYKGKTDDSKGTIPTCVWEKNNHTLSREYCKWHPTQKPFFILERVIKAYTNEGDTVLDFFSGSGSTAISSLNTDRGFIGCELDKEYYDKSLERIETLQR